MEKRTTRRDFIHAASMTGASLAISWPGSSRGADTAPKPALLGGPKAHPGGFPGWPVFDSTEEEALLGALRSGAWFRGNGDAVARFEAAYREMTGAKHCLATSSGTAALTAALGAMDIGPGDEVIVPPYTFVATYNVVALNYALPVFVDTDPESFQIDAGKIEAAITPTTKAILPVHIAGSPADLDRILEIANRRNVPVIEDACQAHLAEWRGRKVGNWGLAGCFSFQASKNLASGEGGTVLSNDEHFADACASFHHQGRFKQLGGANWQSTGTRGSNLRLSEFQGALLVAQMARVVQQTERRTANADYLSSLLREIPGIEPAKLCDGATRSAYHLYMFRYDKDRFAGLDRSKFLKALSAEGVPASSGYRAMNKGDYVQGLASNPHFLRIYGERRMNEWSEQARNLPQNDRVCEEAVWFTQNLLLGTKIDMEQIADAIRKIQTHSAELAKA